MIFKEFGNKNKPVLILIHGGGLSWWNYKDEIELLQKNYYIITPVLDGHGDEFKTVFLSIEDESNKIITYIKENFNGKVFALCGLSIGAQIVTDILSKESDITKYAVIESALLCPSRFISMLSTPIYNIFYHLIKYKWYSSLQAKSLNIPDKLLNSYYKDSSKMTKKSLINLTKSNESYSIPSSIKKSNAKVLILVGKKELPVMKKSAALLNINIENSVLDILKDKRHGELSLCCPKQYVQILNNFFIK